MFAQRQKNDEIDRLFLILKLDATQVHRPSFEHLIGYMSGVKHFINKKASIEYFRLIKRVNKFQDDTEDLRVWRFDVPIANKDAKMLVP